MKSVFKSISKKFGGNTGGKKEGSTGASGSSSSPPPQDFANSSPSPSPTVESQPIAAHQPAQGNFPPPAASSGASSSTASSSNTGLRMDADGLKGGIRPVKKSVIVPTATAAAIARSAEGNSPVEDYSKDLPNDDGLTKADLLKPIPTLNEAPANNRISLLSEKLRLCALMFDWSEDAAGFQRDSKAKEAKRQQLLELVDFISKNKLQFPEVILGEIVAMVAKNLFRSLPPRSSESPSEDDDPVFEPSWPHLQIVYEFFLRFIVSNDLDIRALKKFIHGPFILKLLELFDSEDHRERDYLKTILHRIYAKFMSLRAFIRKSINNVFFCMIYEGGPHNGIAELLEILGSIINGFALPLKAEHRTFLKRVLIPMHSVRHLNQFHAQLSYCLTQFLDKDPTLAIPVIGGLVKFWPVTNSAKEILFLNELEELLELTPQEQFKEILPSLFRVLTGAIGSPHFQVAERALFLWHNEYISNLIADSRQDIVPLLYGILFETSQNHWNSTVASLALNVMKIFLELDGALVAACEREFESRKAAERATRAERDRAWKTIEQK